MRKYLAVFKVICLTSILDFLCGSAAVLSRKCAISFVSTVLVAEQRQIVLRFFLFFPVNFWTDFGFQRDREISHDFLFIYLLSSSLF